MKDESLDSSDRFLLVLRPQAGGRTVRIFILFLWVFS